MSGGPDPRALLDALVREQSGQLIASLTRVLGSGQLDLVHDCVQEALLQALRVWSFEGVPERPAAWLVHVAKNKALDALRRARNFAAKERELERWAERAAAAAQQPPHAAADDDGDVRDDVLRLMFLCCHPSLPPESRVALTLKCVAGFHTEEIARALLAEPAAVEQRLVRAKRTLRDAAIAMTLPRASELAARLDAVLDALYLLFTEGYAATRGDALVRPELVQEAIRLGELVAARRDFATPAVHALLALMHLQGARLPARTNELGELQLLSDQDRAKHDRDGVRRGLLHLAQSMGGDELTPWHLEAGIAAVHACAGSHAATDWKQIRWWYDRLVEQTGSPVAALNRAIAVGHVDGPVAALRLLDALQRERALARYALLPAARGEFLARLGRNAEAGAELARAERLAANAAQKRWLAKKREALPSRPSM